ncbi:ketopantoate reductase family protein [Olivibacter sitiensis]|uniref:ketopantoate reductase family protein n=1 Tax=Olivibacter sitiensis TaxID=376470 RepID=UPI0003F65F8D|nr:ketopantoate reductase family protein [Olivibacter sitiensis]
MRLETSTIKRVYFLGLGALGTMYASKLHTYNSDLVKVVVDEDRKRDYEKEAILVNDIPYHFSFITPASDEPAADLIIVAVKQHHLEAALPLVAPFVSEGTTILSLLNGISSEAVIADHFGQEHILYAFGLQMDALRIGRQVNYAHMGYIVFGEKDNSISDRVNAVKELLGNAGIPYQVPPDILKAMWFKFMLNVAVNQVSALLELPFKVFRDIENARQLLVLAAKEVQAIANKKGIDLLDEDINKMVEIVVGLYPEGKTSMLQDVEAKRATELAIFAGEVRRQGELFHVSTPINDFLYHALSLKEKSYLLHR